MLIPSLMFALVPHKLRNDAEPFYGAYRPLTDVAQASSNTMDTTLSEAPNLLSNRPVLTPALVSEQAFFSFQGSESVQAGREEILAPGGGENRITVADCFVASAAGRRDASSPLLPADAGGRGYRPATRSQTHPGAA